MTRMDVIAPVGGGFRDFGSNVQVGGNFFIDIGKAFGALPDAIKVLTAPNRAAKQRAADKFVAKGKEFVKTDLGKSVQPYFKPGQSFGESVGAVLDVVPIVAGSAVGAAKKPFRDYQARYEEASGETLGETVGTVSALRGGRGGNMSGFAPLQSLVQQQISPWTSVGGGIKV